MCFKIHSESKHNTVQLNEFKAVGWTIAEATTLLEDKMAKLKKDFLYRY